MAWIAVAIAGSAVVGAVTSGIGGAQAAGASNQASANQATASANELAFAKQQYADWNRIYGPIRENLSEFYQGLTSDSLIASGLKNYDLEYQAVEQELQRSFTQRGIDSPSQDMLNQEAAIQAVEFKATLRNDAPLQVARLKQGFLNGNTQNPAALGVTSSLRGEANRYSRDARDYAGYASAGYAGAGRAITGGIQNYLQYQQYNTRANPVRPDLAGYPTG